MIERAHRSLESKPKQNINTALGTKKKKKKLQKIREAHNFTYEGTHFSLYQDLEISTLNKYRILKLFRAALKQK